MHPEVERSATSRFLDEIGRYPLLTPDEEIICSRAVQRMLAVQALDRKLTRKDKRIIKLGMRARERFVQGNMRLVVYVAKEFMRKRVLTLGLMDVVQEGAIGLLRAVEKYDPERGYKFSTYAYWWIKQAIHKAIFQKDSLIRRPMGVAELAYKFKTVAHKLTLKLGRTPTREELAEELKTTVAELELYLVRGMTVASLDTSGGEETSSLHELLADPTSMDREAIEDELDNEARYAAINEAMPYLTEQQQRIIKARYSNSSDDPVTYAELGREFKISRERARTLTNKAIARLASYAIQHERGTLMDVVKPLPTQAQRSERSLCA